MGKAGVEPARAMLNGFSVASYYLKDARKSPWRLPIPPLAHKIVGIEGLEPTRPKALTSKASTATDYAIFPLFSYLALKHP